MDRFIPNRSAMDFDYAHYMLTTRGGMQKPSLNSSPPSEASEAYRKLLAETFNMNRTRILAFKDKPPTLVEAIPNYSVPRRRHIPKIPEWTLDAPDILDDEYLNLLDWGSCNVLSIALGNTVHLWDEGDGSNSELVTIDEESGPVTSVKWAPDGRHIAVALNNSEVQLWDSTANTLVRAFRGGHAEGSGIGAMDWNNHNILTTGGMDSRIINIDVRARAHLVESYRGHQQDVCGLKWSASGHQLASGGKDNLLHIWDRRRPTRAPTQWLHRLKDHTAAVKALAWCPFQSSLLASGGEDRCIKFWNSSTGACLNSVDTGSQVCALLWNQKERELLSSHGLSRNQLTLWKYPSMVKVAELSGHTSTVLYMAQSPDGCTVASAAGDETLMLWNVFGKPEVWIVGDGVSEEEQMKAAKHRGVCSSHSSKS